jgi:hypothetical protein
MQNKKKTIYLWKYILNNLLIIISWILLFSIFFSLSNNYSFIYLLELNSRWLFWLLIFILPNIFSSYSAINILLYVASFSNFILLVYIYILIYKYNKIKLGYIITLIYTFSFLLIWTFFQLILMST